VRPANEHRIVLPRLLFFVDYLVFGGRERPLVVFGLCMLAALVVLIARCAVAGSSRSPPARVTTVAFVTVTLCSGTQIPCLGWSFAVQFMAQSLLPAVALALLLRAEPRPRHVALAAACAAGATFSIASSLLSWPVLVIVAALRRLGPGSVAGLVLAGAACWWVYVLGGARLGPAGGGVDVVVPALAWSLTHLGSAWQLDPTPCLALGAFGWLLLGAALRPAYWHDARTRTLVAVAGLWSLYSLAIGYGRHDLGRGEALAGRYAPGPLLFWACLLAAHLRAASHRARRWIAVVAAVLVAMLVYKQAKASRRWFNVKEARTVAALSFLLGDLDTPAAPGSAPCTTRWAPSSRCCARTACRSSPAPSPTCPARPSPPPSSSHRRRRRPSPSLASPTAPPIRVRCTRSRARCPRARHGAGRRSLRSTRRAGCAVSAASAGTCRVRSGAGPPTPPGAGLPWCRRRRIRPV